MVTILYHFRVHQVVSLGRYIGEIIYIQNYTGPLWLHEWSLAVEEHFYILLPILFLLLIRLSPRRENPFRAVPSTFLLVALACFAARVEMVSRFSSQELQDWSNYGLIYAPTHNRLDGLFFGVFLGYLQHFRSDFLQSLLCRKSVLVGAAFLSALLLSPALLLPQRNKVMVTAGLTASYLGFGILLMLSLHVRGILPGFVARPCSALGDGLAAIGMYSYSIYLWHEPVRVVGFALIRRLLGFPLGPWVHFFVYLTATILVGVTFSRLVEYPILKLRDRFLPGIPKTASATQAEKNADWQPDQPPLTNSLASD
jgi:peptidoglycan/LPS O-acetylase OafA/YrhL